MTEHELVLVEQASAGMIEPTKENGFTAEMIKAVKKENDEKARVKKMFIDEFGKEEGLKRFKKLTWEIPFD